MALVCKDTRLPILGIGLERLHQKPKEKQNGLIITNQSLEIISIKRMKREIVLLLETHLLTYFLTQVICSQLFLDFESNGQSVKLLRQITHDIVLCCRRWYLRWRSSASSSVQEIVQKGLEYPLI